MPLSEHEQRQLELIEQALYRDDRRLGRLVRSSDPRVHYRRRVVQASFGVIVGAGMVAAGLILTQTWHMWLAVAGVVVVLVCGIWSLSSWRHKSGVTPGAAGRGPAAGPRSRRRGNRNQAGRAGMMERLDERWRRRQEGGR